MLSSVEFASGGEKYAVICTGVRGGDGVERSVKFVSAAIEELDEMVERVRCRSCVTRLALLSAIDGCAGRVAVERAEDVDVRRSCLCAGDDEEGEERMGEADVVRMLVGEPARKLEGDEGVADIWPEAESGSTVVRGAKGAGFPVKPWPYECPRMSGWGLSACASNLLLIEWVEGGRVMDCR